MRRRYRGYSGRKRPGRIRLVILTLLFWSVSGLVMIGFLHGGPAALFEAKSEDVAKMYIGNIFPTVSRSSDYESRDASGPSLKPASEEKGILVKESRRRSFSQ